MQKPVVGGRAKWTGDRIEYGTIVAVSPSGKKYQVKWDHPDEYGNEITMHDWHPASGVRPV